MRYLKIKDNVDLEELEKFGFEKAKFNPKYYIRYIYIDKEINYETLYLDIEERKIFAYDDLQDCEIEMQQEWVDDLIKADMVEVVED